MEEREENEGEATIWSQCDWGTPIDGRLRQRLGMTARALAFGSQAGSVEEFPKRVQMFLRASQELKTPKKQIQPRL